MLCQIIQVTIQGTTRTNSLISFLGRNAPLTPSNFLTHECHLSQRGQDLKKKQTESGSFIQLQRHWWKNLLWPSLLTAGAELPPLHQKNSIHNPKMAIFSET